MPGCGRSRSGRRLPGLICRGWVGASGRSSSRSPRGCPLRSPRVRHGRKGIPDRARTCSLRLRRPTLYPIELRGLISIGHRPEWLLETIVSEWSDYRNKIVQPKNGRCATAAGPAGESSIAARKCPNRPPAWTGPRGERSRPLGAATRRPSIPEIKPKARWVAKRPRRRARGPSRLHVRHLPGP
jgi:hypothetical protein